MTARAVIVAITLVTVAGGSVPAGAQTPPPLSGVRYTAFDRLLGAAAAADDEAAPAAAKALAAACAALDPADPLQAAFRPVCKASGAGVKAQAAQASCRTRRACSRAADATGRAIQRLAAALRAANPVVVHEVSDRACRNVLRTSARDLRAITAIGAIFRAVARAMLTSSHADDEAAQRRLGRAAEARSDGEQYRQFQARCR